MFLRRISVVSLQIVFLFLKNCNVIDRAHVLDVERATGQPYQFLQSPCKRTIEIAIGCLRVSDHSFPLGRAGTDSRMY